MTDRNPPADDQPTQPSNDTASRYPERPLHIWSIPAEHRPAGTVLTSIAPHDFVVRDLAVYLVVKDRVLGWVDTDRERAHEYALNVGGVVAMLPVVGDYRPTAAEAGPECATTYRAEAGDCDGPADRQVTYRSSRNLDKVLDTHGPLCNAHAVYEQRRARAAGQIADSTIDPYGHARP